MSRTYKDKKRDMSWYRRNTTEIPSEWKRGRKRIRKAKEKQALRKDKEIPTFKKTDKWDWL